jgi:hypothetical protein
MRESRAIVSAVMFDAVRPWMLYAMSGIFVASAIAA